MTALLLIAVLALGGWNVAEFPALPQQDKPPAEPPKPRPKPPINPDETGGPRGAVMLRGTVVDAAGKELAEVKVAVVSNVDAKQRWETSTDAAGRFQLPDLPAGMFTLELSRPGYRTGRHLGLKLDSLLCSVRVAMQPGEAASVVTERFAELRGRVRDGAGDPVADAQVEIRGGTFARGLSLLTDAEGEFHVPNLPSGDYRVRVTAPGFEAVERPLPVKAQAESRMVTVTFEMRRK
jgi:hypothetical protein